MELRLFVLVAFVFVLVTACEQGGNWTDTYSYHFVGTTISTVSGLPEGDNSLPVLETWANNRSYKSGLQKGFGHNAYDWTTVKDSIMVGSEVSYVEDETTQIIPSNYSGTLTIENGNGRFELDKFGGTEDLVMYHVVGEFLVSEAQATLNEIAQVRQHSFTSTREFSIHWLATGHRNHEPFEIEFTQLVHAVGEYTDSYRDNGNLTFFD